METVVQLLQRVHGFATTIGAWMVAGIGAVLPVEVPPELALVLGWLTLATVVLALGEMARNVAWVVVGAGWLLVIVLIGLAAVEG